VVLYEDEDSRGRAPGEVAALVEREMRARRPKLRAVRSGGYRAAVPAALDLAAPGDVVLVMYEKLAPMQALLTELGAVRSDGVMLAPDRAAGASIGPGRTIAGWASRPVSAHPAGTAIKE
jgi:cyanophycin synthetase